MNEFEIKNRINQLEAQKLQYKSWLSSNINSNSISFEEKQRVQASVDNIEKELDELYDTLKTAELFPDKKFEATKISSKINENNYGATEYSAIDAQEQARSRFYGMSKLKQSIAKITGKKKKFEALANKAYDSMTPQEEQALASEIGKMFR